MKVVVCYVHPVLDLTKYQALARRFVQTYQDNPPGFYPHEVYVLVNGFKYPALEQIFKPLGAKYETHTNVGKDIGAFQMAAEKIPADLMLFLGSPVFFQRSGWLDRIMDVYLDRGPGLYGAFAYQVPIPHIRTTCFWCSPDLLNAYPLMIADHHRYQFEHGRDSLTIWASRMGMPTFLVTWDGVFEMKDWHPTPKSKCLMIDQHVERHHIP